MSHSAGDNPRDLPTFSQFACSEQTMLSKVKLVCILEAANELPKQRNRVHWVHPFNIDVEKGFRKFYEDVRTHSINCSVSNIVYRNSTLP